MTRSRIVIVGWMAWACLVLSQYYVQLLRVLGAPHMTSRREALLVALPVILVIGGAAIAQRAVSSRPRVNPPRPAQRAWLGTAAAAALACAAVLTLPWMLVWPRLEAALSGISAPGLPSFGEAIGRIVIAVTGATLVAAATVIAGTVVLRIIGPRFESRAEHVLFAAVSGVAVISYGSLVLALMGIYRPMTVALLISAALAAGVPRARTIGKRIRLFPISSSLSRTSIPWLALIVVALGYALIAALAPEKEYDALWYHLYLPRAWLEAGRPVDLLEEYISLYPLTWELMFGAAMTLGGAVAAKLLHFACLPLLAVLVWTAARRFFPAISGAAAAAFLLITPTVLWESSTAYVDLALALHAAAACFALARYAAQKDRGWGALASLQFGLAAATKHLGIVVMLVSLIAFVIWWAQHWGRMRVALSRAALIGLLALIIPSPWYMRSWLASGNPVFPEMFSLFGAAPAERWDALTERGLARFKGHFGTGRSPVDLARLPWDVTVHGATFGGSLGPLFLVLAPGILCVPGWRRREAWLAAGIAGYVAVWASPISSYQLRFLVPIVPALALLASSSLTGLTNRAEHSTRDGASALTTAVLFLGVLNMPPFTPFHEADRAGWAGWLTHVLRDSPLRVVIGRESENTYLTRAVPSFGAWQWINANLPEDVRVLTTTGGDQLYAHRARIPYDAAVARPAVWVTEQDLHAAAAALRRLGITHVLIDRRELFPMNEDSPVLASPGFQQACAVEYTDARFSLCRIDYARLASPRPPRPQ